MFIKLAKLIIVAENYSCHLAKYEVYVLEEYVQSPGRRKKPQFLLHLL